MILHNKIATTPPMGWNSWDCFGGSVREDEVLAIGKYMSRHMAEYGWQYVVIDSEWYFDSVSYGTEPESVTVGKTGLNMDGYGRLAPSPIRFHEGFAELGKKLHAKGCKFGIHLMRGIPRAAYEANLPIYGTKYHARDIADRQSLCAWCDLCYGIDMTRPGAQAYYDSVLALCAAWGVDFVKYDDIAGPYHAPEVEAVSKAIAACGRPMVLSLSPGNNSDIANLSHMREYADMWRITGDIWDGWWFVKHVAGALAQWAKHAVPGAWPDADMLPFGRIGIRTHGKHGPAHMTHLTHEEQVTHMTLLCITRSPLFMGGYLPDNDDWTLKLLTNAEVLAVNQKGDAPRLISRSDSAMVWCSDMPGGSRAVAFLNLGDTEDAVSADLGALGFDRTVSVRDLWQKKYLGTEVKKVEAALPPHSSWLFLLSDHPEKSSK